MYQPPFIQGHQRQEPRHSPQVLPGSQPLQPKRALQVPELPLNSHPAAIQRHRPPRPALAGEQEAWLRCSFPLVEHHVRLAPVVSPFPSAAQGDCDQAARGRTDQPRLTGSVFELSGVPPDGSASTPLGPGARTESPRPPTPSPADGWESLDPSPAHSERAGQATARAARYRRPAPGLVGRSPERCKPPRSDTAPPPVRAKPPRSATPARRCPGR